ncbi:putative MFS-type transporter Rv1877/MT1926 [Talaromyces islandicus]|uniref:Putative MFS-type transporter Rv1877/MT1926 n=1 Tax=Talaromyces islandicus TaxID=28573 RepID=A0A0U1M4G1_TALIS|nr:putative MFS-type transporter Rv1877/MT1926 [Talaromyces islandicus]
MGRHGNAEKSLQDQTNILPIGQLLVVFSGLAVSLLICFIDQNGLSVALPTISQDLNAQQTISWAGTSALIANTVCTVLYGRLSDIFGRKSVYLSVLGLLSIADLLCGLSQNAAMLYVFRAVAVSDVVTLQDRGKYQGILGSCVGLGNVIGPFIAAAFVQNTSWRDFFYLLCPLAAVCLGITWFLLPSKMRPESMKTQVKKIDFYGILTSTIAIIFVLIPVSGGGLYFEWDSPMVISMLAIGGCSFIAFLFIQWKVALLPMMPLSLFKNRVITALFTQSFLLGAAYQSLLYYLPLYFQNGRGWTPIESALLTMPMVLLQSAASIGSGQYMSRRNRYLEVICTGFALWTLGSGLTLMFDQNTSKGVICGVVIIVGSGIGCTFQPTLVAMQAHTTMSKRAVVISVRNFFRCGGGAVGLAVSAAILQAVLKKNLPENYQYLAHSTYSIPKQDSVPAADWDVIVNAYIKASHAVFILHVPLVGLSLLCCLFIKDKGLNKPEEKNASTSMEAPNAATESTASTQVDIDVEAGGNGEVDDIHDTQDQPQKQENEKGLGSNPVPEKEAKSQT